MTQRVSIRTTCNRDCPDACGLVADVEDGRVVSLRGDPDHPITRGFLCFRTSRFLKRQYHPQRILRPLLRRGDKQVEIPLLEALDLAAERLQQIRKESGAASILHYKSGGSLGILQNLSDYFFEKFGPTTTKRGDICSGAGDEAQWLDFGSQDSNDIFDILNARHVINWGKNVFVSNVHLIPILKEARARGATMTLIDPVSTRSAKLADRVLQIRPDGDIAFALAILKILFRRGMVTADARERCDHLDELEALVRARPMEDLLREADLRLEDATAVAEDLADGPTAILVGWGMQRRLRGAAAVRLLDAISAISGNLWRSGGGVSFSFKRRGAFDLSFIRKAPPPRTLSEPLLGREILAAKDPPIRAIWITCGNPVAMLPDSGAVAKALESTEFTVVLDAFPTDTTRRASLVLPTTTLLEDDDLVGSYGHHWIGESRPVVPAPQGVLTDLQILQEIAKRVGLGHEMGSSAREWKERLLGKVAGLGGSLSELEKGAVKNPLVGNLLFAEGRVFTPSGRVNLIHEIPDPEEEQPGYPLCLLSNSTERAQSSQWETEPLGNIPARIHPESAEGIQDGHRARLVSRIGSLFVTVKHDADQRRDIVIIPKGGHFDAGWSANALIEARTTDHGEGAAYLSTRVRLEPLTA